VKNHEKSQLGDSVSQPRSEHRISRMQVTSLLPVVKSRNVEVIERPDPTADCVASKESVMPSSRSKDFRGCSPPPVPK
jgi:hypothetical protein